MHMLDLVGLRGNLNLVLLWVHLLTKRVVNLAKVVHVVVVQGAIGKWWCASKLFVHC